MQEYAIKRGFGKSLATNMTDKLVEHFGCEPVQDGDVYRISYGALESLEVSLGAGGKTLRVSTVSKQNIDDNAVILDTNRRFRIYLDEVTGYTTKERTKKAKKLEG
jgi:hypothetical protein